MILRRVFVWVFGSLGFLIETLNFQFVCFGLVTKSTTTA